MYSHDYNIIRSKRKTMCIEVGAKGIVVRVPIRTTKKQIQEFVSKHDEWIKKQLSKVKNDFLQSKKMTKLTDDDILMLRAEAQQYIQRRVDFFARLIGVTYGKITIRNQRTRWGSCTSKGNLSFNCLLMLTPPQVIDSVIVHELCHIKQMNHSKDFYKEVISVYPDYYKWNKWLKENGSMIMMRAGHVGHK